MLCTKYVILTVGYHKLTDKSYNQLVELKYNNVYLGPFYAYIFYEKNYNLEDKLQQTVNIIINYIKKFSTSDIIKQYNCIHDSNPESHNNTNHPDEPLEEQSEEQDKVQFEETGTVSTKHQYVKKTKISKNQVIKTKKKVLKMKKQIIKKLKANQQNLQRNMKVYKRVPKQVRKINILIFIFILK